MPRTIIAIGWGYLVPKSSHDRRTTHVIDREIVRRSGKKHPNLLFIPTASHDAPGYVETVKKYFGSKHGCHVDALLLYGRCSSIAEIRQKIAWADIIYVGGGNTLRMMRMWRKYGVDRLLVKAWKRGAVMCGLSAGSICWFQHGHSDSRKGADPKKKFKFMKVKGLGMVGALHCPHYDSEKYRRLELHTMMNHNRCPAIALDDFAAIEIIDDTYRILSSAPSAKAYLVRKTKGEVIEKIMKKKRVFENLNTLLK